MGNDGGAAGLVLGVAGLLGVPFADSDAIIEERAGKPIPEIFFDDGEDAFRALLYAPEMHDPDLIIRTSGEQRMSNYLLWQSAYAELVFRDELWPDFSRDAFAAALDEYAGRRRRFGGR